MHKNGGETYNCAFILSWDVQRLHECVLKKKFSGLLRYYLLYLFVYIFSRTGLIRATLKTACTADGSTRRVRSSTTPKDWISNFIRDLLACSVTSFSTLAVHF